MEPRLVCKEAIIENVIVVHVFKKQLKICCSSSKI
jgi:hypothetical protein